MNRKLPLFLVVFAAALAGQARADDITIEPVAFASTASRAQVVAELQAWRAARVNPWAAHYNPLAAFRGVRTRDAVVGEYLAERDAVAALNGEDSGSKWLTLQAAREARPVQVAGQGD